MELETKINITDSSKNKQCEVILTNKFNYYYKKSPTNNLYLINDNINNKTLYFINEKKIYNFDGLNYLIENHDRLNNYTIMEYYEGDSIFIFFYEDKLIIINNNKLIQESSYIYTIIYNIIISDLEIIDKNNCYHFILINDNINNIINYKNILKNHKYRLVYIYCINDNNRRNFTNYFLQNQNIIYPKIFNNISDINLENNNFDFSEKPTNKGYIIFVNDQENLVLKLQNFKYMFYKAIGPEKHIFNGFIDLYQKNKLICFMRDNIYHKKYNKIINPYNNNDVYDTIGCIDCMFKLISNELFNIYCNFFDINNNFIKIYNIKYDDMPLIYKKIIKYASIKKYKKSRDFYIYLKKSNIVFFLDLVKNRKIFNNWIINNNKDYSFIFKRTNKLTNKLAGIYINKLFPEIKKDNIIYQKC